jgi:hypothetical protein
MFIVVFYVRPDDHFRRLRVCLNRIATAARYRELQGPHCAFMSFTSYKVFIHLTPEIASTHIGYPVPCLVVFACDGEFYWWRIPCVTLFSTANHDAHQQRTEHHTGPGHVSEPELKASENLMVRLAVTSLSLYKPSYVGIICIYPIIYDDHMWRSVQAKNLFNISSVPPFQPPVPNHWYVSCCSSVTVPFIPAFLFSLLPGVTNFSHN